MSTHPTPPGPRGSLLLGSFGEFGRGFTDFLERCALEYGPIVRMRMVHRTAYLLSDPALIEVPLLSNYRNFPKNRLFFRRVKAVLGNGLVSSEGEFWRQQRKQAAPGFHRERIEGYGQIMQELTLRYVNDVKGGETRDFDQDMLGLTSEIVARCLFDEGEGADMREVSAVMEDLMHEVARRMTRVFISPPWMPTPSARRYRQIVARIDKLAYGFIARHRENLEKRNTLLAMLMLARDDDGRPMSERQLRDEAVTLFLAGHETTANALAWTGALLGAHPEHQERIHSELQSVCGDRAASVADLPQLTYTEAVIKEAMRLYPPVPLITREAIEDCMIGPYPIKAGTIIHISPWVQHRLPTHFDQPEAFLPERWLNGLSQRLPRFTYMPFGGGPRTCIGDRFAMMEAVLILALIVQRFQLQATRQQMPVPFASISLRPSDGVPLRLVAR